MKVVTMRLKRYKTVRDILSILILPIRLPVFLFCLLEEQRIFGKILGNIDNILMGLLEWVSIKFKFEEEAFRQKEINPDKFKNLY